MEHTVCGFRFQLYPLPRKRAASTLICYRVGSTRKQETFHGDIEAAKKLCRTIAKQVTSGEAIDALHLTPLDRRIYIVAKELLGGRAVDAVAREYLEAHKALGGYGSLLDAARAFRRQHATNLPSVTLAGLMPELKAHLERKNRDRKTILSLESILKPASEYFANIPINTITAPELEKYLGSLRLAPRTLTNHRSGLIRAWHFAQGRYLPKDQPTAADSIDPISEPEKAAVEIYKPWEFSALLYFLSGKVRAEKTSKNRRHILGVLRCLFLGGFAGPRTVELTRMESTAICSHAVSAEFPHGYVKIDKGVAKRHRSAKRRLIPIQPNLAQWIKAFPFPDGPVSPLSSESSLARAISRAIDELNAERKRSGLRLIGRPKNGSRHSFATYRLPKVKSAAELGIEMNSSTHEIINSYFELGPPADVEAWWKIEPASNVVELDPAMRG